MSRVPEIDVPAARQRHGAGDALFVDIRDEHSYSISHIPGAIRLDATSAETFIAEQDKRKPIIVYCYHGISSISGSAYLMQQGFKDVVSLRGGYEAWETAGAVTSADAPSAARALVDHIASLRVGDDSGLARARDCYHPDVVFQDPMQRIVGREAFLEMNRRALHAASEYRIDFDDVLESPTLLFASWRMVYKPKRGPRLTIVGASRLVLRDGLVCDHRDYWDLLSSFASSTPVLARAHGWLMKKLS
ncbi:MAG: nuclear transport factor 2 family protein [Myxococcales bacterium]|nr:nuclear transport factor 2 family protein [Myxococcales bacterium]